MLINADFSQRVSILPDEYNWVATIQPGIERVMLDRLGGEKCRATSIVRYAPNSFFPGHHHPGGEEILVLSGIFSEGGGHYPAGWYLRNPPGSSHQPSSKSGALIFVKLQQMHANEEQYVRIDTSDPASWHIQSGREICPLFAGESEQVWLQRSAPNEVLRFDSFKGLELLVLSGELMIDGRSHGKGGWVRLPATELPSMVAGPAGTTIYLKTGHLAIFALAD